MRKFQYNGVLDEDGKEVGADSVWLAMVYENGAKRQFIVERGQYVELSDHDIAAVERGPHGLKRLELFDEVERPRKNSTKVDTPQAASGKVPDPAETGDPPAIESMNKPAVIEELETLGVEFNKRDSADDLRALLAESREAAND